MRLAHINLDSLNFDGLEGIQKAYPIPMPILAKEMGDSFLLYSLVSRQEWSKTASMMPTIQFDQKTIVPIVLPSDVFKANFMPLGGSFDGTGVYGKVPKPVIALKVDVPCSYNSIMGRELVEPNSIVVKINNSSFRHFSVVDFDNKFVKDLNILKGMDIKVNNPQRDMSMDNNFEFRA